VAYVSNETKIKSVGHRTLFYGPPILAVEILSPSDEAGKIVRKVSMYLRRGVKTIWVVDPGFQTVTVFTKGQKNRYFQVGDTLTADPHLPGFSCPVADIFR
jgi:Uma2 family endonuclease